MNILKIAFRSVQHRGLGSLLTILSMALGVMMVVSVLAIYGLVSESFRSNSSYGYDLLVGARGGGMQLTLSSVFYLSRPIETIPYEYYLAFQDRQIRSEQLKNSIAFRGLTAQCAATEIAQASMTMPGIGGWTNLAQSLANDAHRRQQIEFMQIESRGIFSNHVQFAIPILLGDTYQPEGKEYHFKVCATNSDFFHLLELDSTKKSKFAFSNGRAFENNDQDAGFFGCVMGSFAAKQSAKKVGDKIKVTHGVPGTSNAHLHDQLFTILGILEPTGTPHDRAVFVNMEGFYLINDHVKPVEDDSMFKSAAADPFSEDDADKSNSANELPKNRTRLADEQLQDSPLPIEQRELTSLLIRSGGANDDFGLSALILQQPIEQGDLERSLNWSSFRPVKAQTSAQCVFPVQEVSQLFGYFVEPAKWVLLALTTMICVVSGLSILVGIYNSMSQRHHEIAVMRALGARRSHVMLIMFSESVLLALAGGLVGWVAGHALNSAISPIVENQTGVAIRFWDFAPAEQVFMPLYSLLGNSKFASNIVQFRVSPELLLIPGLIFLAILVGVYPAVSAYRTDVAKSLGK